MNAIAERLATIRARMERAARSVNREAAHVKLLAVSKTQSAERVREAAAIGLRAFGENRVQEAEAKIPEVLRICAEALEWHADTVFRG